MKANEAERDALRAVLDKLPDAEKESEAAKTLRESLKEQPAPTVTPSRKVRL